MNQQAKGSETSADTKAKVRVIDRPARYALGRYEVTCANGTVRNVTAENRAAAIRRAERGIDDFKASQ